MGSKLAFRRSLKHTDCSSPGINKPALFKEGKMADVSDYYKIISIEGNVLHTSLEKFWSDQVIEQFGAEIQEIFTKAVKSFSGKPFIQLANWSESPVLGPKAIVHMTESMKIFKENNGYKVVEVVPAGMVKVGLSNAASQSGGGGDDFRIVVNDLDTAWKEVKRLQQELAQAEKV